jgi:hypothetical protein
MMSTQTKVWEALMQTLSVASHFHMSPGLVPILFIITIDSYDNCNVFWKVQIYLFIDMSYDSFTHQIFIGTYYV